MCTRYAVIVVGCLCCDTPSKLAGIFSSQEEAKSISMKLNMGLSSCTRVSRVFEMPCEDFLDIESYRDIIEQGTKKLEAFNKSLNKRKGA